MIRLFERLLAGSLLEACELRPFSGTHGFPVGGGQNKSSLRNIGI
jgi:hypothetical protein